jgi:hypothetical protein
MLTRMCRAAIGKRVPTKRSNMEKHLVRINGKFCFCIALECLDYWGCLCYVPRGLYLHFCVIDLNPRVVLDYCVIGLL